MSLRIAMPQAIHEVGGRTKNEDSIWPLIHKATEDDLLFLVCDGVGGASKGEVASQIVSQGFAEFVQQHPPGASMDETYLKQALRHVERLMSAHTQSNPESIGMATTLTLLYLGAEEATIAWIGDSKIYHFREGDILFESRDHSLVEKLVQEGVISREEAANHPQRNVILRAVKGSHDPAEIEVLHIRDLQSEDVFLLCSDGITENWSSQDLSDLFATSPTLSVSKQRILTKSTGRTNDNFSAYLLRLDSKEKPVIPVATIVEPVSEVSVEPLSESSGFPFGKILKGVGLGILGVGLICVLFLLFRGNSKDDEVRHAVQHALEQEQFIPAMYYADVLVNLDHNDPEQKKKYEAFRDSVKDRLILWLNDSLESGLTLIGCQKLKSKIDTFESKTLLAIQATCDRRLDRVDEHDWIEEGEGWWTDGDLAKAGVCFAHAQALKPSPGLTLRKNILEKAEIGAIQADEDPLQVIEVLEEANEDFEQEKFEQALKGFEQIEGPLTQWGLDSLVTEKIKLCEQNLQ